MAVLIDNGKVLDAAAEPGAYEWQSDASPSFFAGNFGGMFGEMWRRFAFGGATYQDQAVYFINSKEIMGNGFGTMTPVTCEDWTHSTFNAHKGTELPMMVSFKCHGMYTFMINRPDLFLRRVGGTANMYFKDELTDQMRMEVLARFQEMLNTLCGEEHRVSPMKLISKASKIKEMMAENRFDLNIEERGISIKALEILSVTLDEESKNKIDKYEATSNDRLFMDRQQERTAATIATVGSNPAGLGVGFLGIGMMNQAMSGSMNAGMIQQAPSQMMPQMQQAMPQQPMYQQSPQQPMQQPMYQQSPQQPMPQQPMYQQPPQQALPQQPVYEQPPTPAPAAGGVICTCGQPVTGKFCANCGAAAPEPAPAAPAVRFCTNCGAKATGGKFCAECGTPM